MPAPTVAFSWLAEPMRPDARHSRVIKNALLALAALALAACTGGPTGSPTAIPTPGPTASPTVGPIDHPTGATDVILRMEIGGGFVPMNFIVIQAPDFTLYGDGTVIYRQTDTRLGEPFGGQPLLPFLVGHLDEDSVQALLGFALDGGGLAGAAEFYPALNIADAPDTTFTINADGRSKTVTVGALGMEDPTDPTIAIRQRLAQLAVALGSFEERGQNGELGDVTTYEADFYRASLLEDFGEPTVEPAAWPWPDVSPDDFVAVAESGWQQAILDREHVAELIEVPSGGHPGVWVEAPDGMIWQLGIRPLLPDEVRAGV